jgi:hypothetical protein
VAARAVKTVKKESVDAADVDVVVKDKVLGVEKDVDQADIQAKQAQDLLVAQDPITVLSQKKTKPDWLSASEVW